MTQALEIPCREGSLIVTAARVQRTGRPVWSVDRRLVGGVGVTSARTGLGLWLHLKDGRRLPLTGVAAADALRLIATLGYVPSDLPTVPQFMEPYTQLTTSCRGGMLHITRDRVALEGASPWNLPRTAIAGVSAVPGPRMATLLISMRNGQLVLIDGVPFEHALQAITILGYQPASLPPLPDIAPPPAALPDRRRRTPLPAPPRGRIVPADYTRRTTPPGGRLIPVLTPKAEVSPRASRPTPPLGGALDTPRTVPVITDQNGGDTWPGANGSKATRPPAASWRARGEPLTPPPERAGLPLEAFLWESEEEEERGGLTRFLPAWLREPRWPPGWLHRPQWRRPASAPLQWGPPAGPREIRPPDWQREPVTLAQYARPAEWLRPTERRQRAARHWPAWLRAPRVRRHDPAPPQARPPEWQRQPETPRLDARPAVWLRQPYASPPAEVRPAEWQRRPARPAVSRRRLARLRRARLRRHDALPPQVRPADWQRRPQAPAPYARPPEWERKQGMPRPDAGPSEWQRRPVAIVPAEPTREAPRSAHERRVPRRTLAWGAGIGAALLVVLAVLLVFLIPSLGTHGHVPAGGPVPPAAAPAQKVFVGSQDGAVYVLDARTGALLWRYQTGGKIESAPAVAGGTVFVGSDDHAVYALRPATKTVLWRYQTGGPVASALTVVGGVVYAGSYDDALYALQASDGTLLWRYPTGNWISGQPAVADGVVYTGSYDDNVYALRASDGSRLWRYQTEGMVASSPVISGGVVYIGSADNDVYALRASDGTVLWHTATGGSVYSSPMLANGVIYVGSGDNYVYALRARDGAVLWRAPTGGIVLSSPAVANGVVYVGSFDGYLYALRAADGSVLWRYQTHDAVVAPPAINNGIVYAGSADGSVYAVSAGSGKLVWSYRTGGRVNWRVAVGT